MTKCGAVLFLTLGLCGVASANIVVDTPSITGPVSGVYTWSYNIGLATGETLSSTNSTLNALTPSGSFFTIYDIVGFVSGSCFAPAGWTCSQQLIGLTPSHVLPTDSASLYNVTFQYTSGTDTAGSGQTISAFGFQSIYNQTIAGTFTGQSFDTGTQGVDQQLGAALVPAASLPEPASLGLMGGSLIALGLLSRRWVLRRRQGKNQTQSQA